MMPLISLLHKVKFEVRMGYYYLDDGDSERDDHHVCLEVPSVFSGLWCLIPFRLGAFRTCFFLIKQEGKLQYCTFIKTEHSTEQRTEKKQKQTETEQLNYKSTRFIHDERML
jgi:hypothetical protein